MSRKCKLNVLPSVEVMCEELEHKRMVLKKFRKYYRKMVSIALDQGGSKLGENEKATWLIATCGFDMTGKAEETERYTSQSHKEKHMQCTGIATLRLLLCALAGMWESTPAKSGEDPELWMKLICSKPPGTSSDELRKGLNWLPLGKCRKMFRLALVHRCMHNQAPGYTI